jgi:hypothetical protein
MAWLLIQPKGNLSDTVLPLPLLPVMTLSQQVTYFGLKIESLAGFLLLCA